MSTRSRSWEIILAGLAFVAVAIYFIGNQSERKVNVETEVPDVPSPPASKPALPSAIVIDLQNLENLKNLENLRNLENLKNLENLEFELKNLDKIIEKRINSSVEEESLEQSLRMVEEKLQQIEKADYKVKLQNNKVFINKDYNVDEADWTEISPGVFVYRESFPISNLKTLNLNMGFGNLNIVGSEASEGELTIRATGSVESAQEIREKLAVLNKTENETAIFDIQPGNHTGFSDRVNLEATLTMPKAVMLDASTSGGHINANNLDGTNKLFTSGGHIALDAISGNTTAESNGGHITCNQLQGRAIFKTSGGHIRVTNADADLRAVTGGGDIDITKFSGQVEAKTAGGNISAQVRSANGPISFMTSAGNIALAVPETFSADLKAKGNTISIAESFQFEGNKSKTNISGTLNGGGIPLTLTCKYGNISITND